MATWPRSKGNGGGHANHFFFGCTSHALFFFGCKKRRKLRTNFIYVRRVYHTQPISFSLSPPPPYATYKKKVCGLQQKKKPPRIALPALPFGLNVGVSWPFGCSKHQQQGPPHTLRMEHTLPPKIRSRSGCGQLRCQSRHTTALHILLPIPEKYLKTRNLSQKMRESDIGGGGGGLCAKSNLRW